MARALGMNPKKLPSLRPSPDQRWKLPVSEFIESCYCKRFGGDPLEHPRLDPESQSSKPTVPKPDLDTSKRSRDTMLQLEDLVVYFANLVTDLEAWLVHGAVSPNLLAQLIMELKEVVAALEHIYDQRAGALRKAAEIAEKIKAWEWGLQNEKLLKIV